MGLRDRLARLIGGKELEERFNLGQYPQFLSDYYSQFGYAGSLYPLQLTQTITGWQKKEDISGTLPNYMTALRRSPPAFAAQLVRSSVMSQARLIFRNRVDRHTFRTPSLKVLEQPWTNGTTGELLQRMEWHAGLAGNAYVLRQPNRLRVLRPDWTAIVYGSDAEPDDPKGALDGEVIGYAYLNGGFTQNNRNSMQVLLPEQVAHWTPLPDPMSPGLGMSWLTPALRDMQQDEQALEYKIGFFTNGATPNLVVKGLPASSAAQFKEWVDQMESNHKGAVNAFKTLYLTAGADATVVGSNLNDLDLTAITSHGETRISYLSRVPAVILGIAAGLKGSSLNAGNYGEARRNFADSWFYAELQDVCAALGAIVDVPGGGELWYDVADVPLLREDSLDAANIEQVKQQTIVAYVNGGFTPESAVQAVLAQDINLLEHTGLVSVQLQPPGTQQPAQPGPEPAGPLASADGPDAPQEQAPNGRSLRSEVPFAVNLPAITINLPERALTIPPATINVDARSAELPASVVNVTVPMPELHFDQPITVNTPEVTYEAPDVNVTVQPAAAPEVRIEQPINVAAPSVTLEQPINVAPAAVTIEPADINIEAPVTVNVPADEPKAVDVVYDGDKVVGVRPRSRRKR